MNRDMEKLMAWKRRSKPINPVSARRARENRERSKVLAEVVRGQPCAARLSMCSGMAVDGHELVSRARGGSITDRGNIVPLCRPCHRFITEHPAWAQENGWAKRKS